MKKILKIIFISLLLVVSYKLRIENYDKIPFPGQSMDEYSFSWVGLSLIRLGYPVGISGIKGYQSYSTHYINVDRVFGGIGTAKGNPLAINHPWFDHPPLLGLISGGYAYLKGARVFEDTGTFLIRKPMVAIGTFSVLLVFILADILYGFKPAFIASVIYATSPLSVIGSRMVQAENGLIPSLLMTLIFLSLYFRRNKEIFLWLAAIFSGFSVIFKLSGVVSFLSGLTIILSEPKENSSKILNAVAIWVVVFLSFFSLFILFGFLYDPKTFFNIFLSNSTRFYGLGSNAFYALITSTKITGNKYLTDAWPLVGWLCFAATFLNRKEKNDRIIPVTIFLYLIIYLFWGSEQYGWYHFPFLPLLVILIGKVVDNALDKLNLGGLAFFLLVLPIGVNLSKLMDIEKFQKFSSFWRLGILGFSLLFLAASLVSEDNLKLFKKPLKILLMLFFFLAVYLNIRYLRIITIDYWYYAT